MPSKKTLDRLANAPTAEELHEGLSKRWSAAVLEEVDTLFMILDEFRCGYATASPEARSALSTLSRSIDHFIRVWPQP